jgi:very-short-patch-repair endonuclease
MRPFIPYGRRLTPRSQQLRRDATRAERKLWYEFLRDLPEKFTRQKPLGNYIADFYCSAARLVIELDGDTHFSETGAARDLTRTAALEAEGVRILRFTNDDVLQTFEGVCIEILARLRT